MICWPWSLAAADVRTRAKLMVTNLIFNRSKLKQKCFLTTVTHSYLPKGVNKQTGDKNKVLWIF